MTEPLSLFSSSTKTQRWVLDRISLDDGSECVEWPFSTDTGGYGRLNFRGTSYSTHRLVCIGAHGNPSPDQNHAAHSCGNRKCGNRNHLRWASFAENYADKYQHGTALLGEKNHHCALTEEDVLIVRQLLRDGYNQRRIAAALEVSQSNISMIASGATWRWLPS